MPEISRFYGIIIRVYYRDHPSAHFHAIYGIDPRIVMRYHQMHENHSRHR
jgi:hypothetical protein